jgi:hypothetical protein
VKSSHELCPSVDVVGINSYGGVTSVGDRYRKAGGSKPIVITEFGPPGTWECAKNSWGIPLEPSSTRKGEIYREAYVRGIRAQKSLCLGSYVFTWGHKNEATPTWFGLFLPDDSQLEAVHVMSELWSGKAPANRCPRIEVPKVDEEEPARGEVIHAKVHLSDPDGDPLAVKWVLTGEVKERSTGGAREKPAAMYDQAIVSSNAHEAQIKMPQEAGTYRLFCYAQDGHGNAAVANAVLRVKK